MICDLDGSLGSRQFLNVVIERTCFTSRAADKGGAFNWLFGGPTSTKKKL